MYPPRCHATGPKEQKVNHTLKGSSTDDTFITCEWNHGWSISSIDGVGLQDEEGQGQSHNAS